MSIVYVVRNRRLYISTNKDAWKVRHITANPRVSLAIPIAKRILFLPWIKIPAATITFSGIARVLPVAEVPPDILHAVLCGRAGADGGSIMTAGWSPRYQSCWATNGQDEQTLKLTWPCQP